MIQQQSNLTWSYFIGTAGTQIADTQVGFPNAIMAYNAASVSAFRPGSFDSCNPPPPSPTNLDAYDDVESYTVAAAVNGLDGGTNWRTAYTDNVPIIGGLGPSDDMESYTVGASLNGLADGLNGARDWDGPYVDR